MCPSHLSHELQCENVHFVGSYFLEHLGILKYDGHGGDGRGRLLCRHCLVTALACLGQTLLGFTWFHDETTCDIGDFAETLEQILSMFLENRHSVHFYSLQNKKKLFNFFNSQRMLKSWHIIVNPCIDTLFEHNLTKSV